MYPLLKFIYSVILYMEHSPPGTQVTNLRHVVFIVCVHLFEKLFLRQVMQWLAVKTGHAGS